MTRVHGSHSLWVMGSCRLPPMLKFVVSSVSCSGRFFSRYSVFRSPQSGMVNEEPLCGCATTKLLFIYLFIYYIINWLLVKHSIFTSDFSKSPGHLVDSCVGWGGMVLMSWSGWRRRKGGKYNVLHNAGINVWTGRVDCMGIGVAFDFFDFFDFFFFFGGGGVNFRLLGLENSSNVITYPEGTKEMFKCYLYVRANPTTLPFLTLIPA